MFRKDKTQVHTFVLQIASETVNKNRVSPETVSKMKDSCEATDFLSNFYKIEILSLNNCEAYSFF